MVILSRRERLAVMLARLTGGARSSSGDEARARLEQIMREVEDEFSGIREDPNSQLSKVSDGRMYPPHDNYEFRSGSPHIRAFNLKGHKTFFGDNGAVRIEQRSDGAVEIDLPGADGKAIGELRLETEHEPN